MLYLRYVTSPAKITNPYRQIPVVNNELWSILHAVLKIVSPASTHGNIHRSHISSLLGVISSAYPQYLEWNTIRGVLKCGLFHIGEE